MEKGRGDSEGRKQSEKSRRAVDVNSEGKHGFGGGGRRGLTDDQRRLKEGGRLEVTNGGEGCVKGNEPQHASRLLTRHCP